MSLHHPRWTNACWADRSSAVSRAAAGAAAGVADAVAAYAATHEKPLVLPKMLTDSAVFDSGVVHASYFSRDRSDYSMTLAWIKRDSSPIIVKLNSIIIKKVDEVRDQTVLFKYACTAGGRPCKRGYRVRPNATGAQHYLMLGFFVS